MRIITNLVFLISTSCFANFNTLLDEFLKNSLNLKQNSLEHSQSVYDRDLYRASKNWSLSSSLSYEDSDLETSVSSNQTQTISKIAELDITKDFENGLSLTLGHDFTDESSSSDSSNFSQSISISQDLGKNFFGRQFYIELREYNERVSLSNIELNENNQKQLYSFYQNYLKSRQSLTIKKLQEDAVERSKTRLAVTRRRVRDGLNEKADLYQAQMELRRQKEELELSDANLAQALSDLSSELHRIVKAREINFVARNSKLKEPVLSFQIDESFDLKKIKAQLSILDLEYDNINRDFYPSVALKGTYSTNEYDAKSSRAFSDGTLGSGDTYYSIGVELSMPLGFEEERVNKAKKKVEILSLEMERRKTIEELKFTERLLKKQMTTRKINLNSSIARIDLAKKNLKENTRLYGIGRVDLDGLIRSEESLIETEKSFVNNWFEYELAVARKASLYGKLLSILQ